MGKRTKSLVASSKAVDPTLDALFSASSGPVTAPSKTRYSELLEKKVREPPKPTKIDNAEEEAGDEELSEISEELAYDDDEEDNDDEDEEEEGESSDNEEDESAEEEAGQDESMVDAAPVELDAVIQATEGERPKERKRKRKDEHEDLEDKYLGKLAAADEPAEKRQKAKQEEKKEDEEDSDDEEEVPKHETLAKDANTSELDKANRTVFVANVSTEAISSKAAKKTLLAHLSTVLEEGASPAQTIESIRFRSTAFEGGSMPKRASFITKSLMEATTKSTHAYVVYSTPSAARTAATKLNGTEVLGRHIRVDSVAHPSPTDHRRCVFVGNLGFVDDESLLQTNDEGETTKKKRNKVPSDVEEGLWRTFSTQGKVESVRVVRDPKTRVGKGFAYVQFYDGNDVEAALLLNEKKFPPMLPRKLRVTRAKDPRKTALALDRSKAKGAGPNGPPRGMKHTPKITPEQQSMAGRAGKLLGRGGAFHQQRKSGPFPGKNQERNNGPAPAGIKAPEHFVFEGRRASAKDGRPKDLKLGKKVKSKGRPHNRGARRAAEWKKKQS